MHSAATSMRQLQCSSPEFKGVSMTFKGCPETGICVTSHSLIATDGLHVVAREGGRDEGFPRPREGGREGLRDARARQEGTSVQRVHTCPVYVLAKCCAHGARRAQDQHMQSSAGSAQRKAQAPHRAERSARTSATRARRVCQAHMRLACALTRAAGALFLL